jgi:hypothetical protein
MIKKEGGTPMRLMKRFSSLAVVLLVIFALAQTAIGAELTGHLSILRANPIDNEVGKKPLTKYFLFSGGKSREVNLPPGMEAKAQTLQGKKVKVKMADTISLLSSSSISSTSSTISKSVIANQIEEVKESSLTAAAGSQSTWLSPTISRWLVVEVYFSDGTRPIDLAYVASLFTGEGYPFTKDEYSAFTYGRIEFSCDGGDIVSGISVGSKNSYSFTGDCQKFAQDVINLVVASGVDVSKYNGIALVANDSFGGYTVGGTTYLTVNGQLTTFKAAWLTSVNPHMVAHEVGGHAENGYAHTCGPDGNAYSENWCTMGGYPKYDSTYGYVPIGHNVSYRNQAGFIPSDKVFVSQNNTSETLELSCPDQTPETAPGYLLARIPAGVDSYGVARYVDLQAFCHDGNYSDVALAEGVAVFKYNLNPGTDCMVQLYDPNRDSNSTWNDAGTPIKPDDPALDLSQVISAVGAVSFKSLSRTTTGFMVEVDNNNPPSGSLVVNILPSEAVSAGAQWNVDGGSWHSSGETVSGLTVGLHTIGAKSISGWVTPTAVTTNISNGQTANVALTYSPQQSTGSLVVYLYPAQAVSAGAQWNVDGGSWHSSGETVSGLTVGLHTIGAKSITNWTAPTGQTVSITDGALTSVTAAYSSTTLPMISLSVAASVAERHGNKNGVITVSRSKVNGKFGKAVAVFYAVGGSAANGTEYTRLSGKIIIPAGKAKANIIIQPKKNTLSAVDKIVSLTLLHNPAYVVDPNQSEAAVTILSDPVVTVTASVPAASRSSGTNGQFIFTREAPDISYPLVVKFFLTGSTAQNGKDDQKLSGQITIPAGQFSAALNVVPKPSKIARGDKTVVVTLKNNGYNYIIGIPNSATVTISD